MSPTVFSMVRVQPWLVPSTSTQNGVEPKASKAVLPIHTTIERGEPRRGTGTATPRRHQRDRRRQGAERLAVNQPGAAPAQATEHGGRCVGDEEHGHGAGRAGPVVGDEEPRERPQEGSGCPGRGLAASAAVRPPIQEGHDGDERVDVPHHVARNEAQRAEGPPTTRPARQRGRCWPPRSRGRRWPPRGSMRARRRPRGSRAEPARDPGPHPTRSWSSRATRPGGAQGDGRGRQRERPRCS